MKNKLRQVMWFSAYLEMLVWACGFICIFISPAHALGRFQKLSSPRFDYTLVTSCCEALQK